MGKILVIMGSSGSGKTTLARNLIDRADELFGHLTIRPLPSYTSREARSDDLPAEYRYVTKTALWQMDDQGELGWLVPRDAERHEAIYGTRTDDLLAVLRAPDTIGIATLMPEILPSLMHALAILGHKDDWIPVYIERPTESKLRARLERFPTRIQEVDSRWPREANWELVAVRYAPRLTFIKNEGTVDEMVQEAVRLIR